MEKNIIGVTLDGDPVIDRGWKNFAEVEKTGEIVSLDGIEFGSTSYLHLKDICLTHYSFSTDGYIDLNHLYNNGHHILSSDEGTTIDGMPFVYLEWGDEEDIAKDKEIISFMGADFDAYDLYDYYSDTWAFIKLNNEVYLVVESEDDTYRISGTGDDAEMRDICLSIYKALSFAELDVSCFIDMNMIDHDASVRLRKRERDHCEHINRAEMARTLGINKVTLYKLDASIKKGDNESKKKLMNYVDLYLDKKYL